MSMMHQSMLVFGDNYGEDVDPSRWVVIYPPYIDKTRKEKEGRRIGKEKCVDNPNMKEIFDCATLLKFQTALELDKAYCRDYWARGRIRVRLFDKDGKPVREDIPTRRILYARVAALIPEHRERVKAAQGKTKGAAKGAAKGNGKAAVKQGKGAPAPTKKKKRGKR